MEQRIKSITTPFIKDFRKKKQQTEQRAEHQKDNELNINKNEKNEKNEKNNNYVATRKKRVYADDDPNKKLAILLLKLIRKNQNIKEPDLDKWANTIRLTIESDKRTGKEVQDMIVWATSNDFWSGVILSPTSLRKHFDKMAIQKNKRKQQNISNDELPETGEDW